MPEHPTGADWERRCGDLVQRVRRAVRSALRRSDGGRPLTDAVGHGAGDVTFELDVVAEREVFAWAEETARAASFSLLTEDAGWTHWGPASPTDFGHGGPRLVCDPVDGTRNLMHDLRSAWTVLAVAGPGASAPRLAEVELGWVAELADSRAALARVFSARRGGGARRTLVDLSSDGVGPTDHLRVDAEPRVDGGYFPFFAFHPRTRARLARAAEGFFDRLERATGADLARCFDDQYIASAGQLALVAEGTYRMVVDARPLLRDPSTQCAKPYDVAGAVLVAREAGAPVLDLAGADLDVPLDADTPVGFCAFANEATRDLLLPLLREALDALE